MLIKSVKQVLRESDLRKKEVGIRLFQLSTHFHQTQLFRTTRLSSIKLRKREREDVNYFRKSNIRHPPPENLY